MAETENKDRYLAARREWLERYGDYIAQARNWRMVAFGSMAIAAIFGAGMVYEADRVHIIPYVVETNHLGQSVHLAQAVNAGTYQQPIVRHVLAHWLRLVRERLPVVAPEKVLYNASYDYVASTAQSALNSYFSRHNPYGNYVNKLGGRTVTITSALPLGKLTQKGGTFQLQWTETQYRKNGAILGETHWQGNLTYAVTQPSNNPQMLNGNPFGIYITNFNWNQMP
ncbi:VirB8/TrbF family protein [Acidithiobacillus sp.]|uniref:VirB8/TrbF family protein n=1 Tax=Acidithiobacillus sp. TaxID=1872118 RepID=UPI003CFFD5ED